MRRTPKASSPTSNASLRASLNACAPGDASRSREQESCRQRIALARATRDWTAQFRALVAALLWGGGGVGLRPPSSKLWSFAAGDALSSPALGQ